MSDTLHLSHVDTRNRLITLRETMSQTPCQPLLIILFRQVCTASTHSYTEPADAIHSRPDKPIPVISAKPSSSKQPKKPMFPPMYTSTLVSNTREPRNLYMATSTTPQRGSAPQFSTSENDAHYTHCPHTQWVDLQIRDNQA